MVDRGFNIEESVRFYQAELAIPSFTRGKSQLHPVDVEKTRKNRISSDSYGARHWITFEKI